MPTRNQTIWTMWQQGLERAPPLVRLCVDSWRQNHPEWNLVVLDERNLREYVDLGGVVDLARKDLTVQKVSGIVRLCLLKDYGGVWVDATVFCRRPLVQWLPEHMDGGFFAFRNPGADRLMSNWFMAAEPESLIVQRLHAAVLAYWRDNTFPLQNRALGQFLVRKLTPVFNKDIRGTQFWLSVAARKILRLYPYFIFHYIFNKVILEDADCRETWHRGKGMNALPPHCLQYLRLQPDGPEQACDEIDLGHCPVYKLNWRAEAEDPYWQGVQARLAALLAAPAVAPRC